MGSQIHVTSIIMVIFSVILLTFYQNVHPFFVRLINSMLLCVLGHFVYENMFIVFMGLVGRSIDGLFLYFIITIGILSLMKIFHAKYPSYKKSPNMFLPYWGLFIILCFMYATNWFTKLQLWYLGIGIDPHNLTWAISKQLGFLSGIILLRRE